VSSPHKPLLAGLLIFLFSGVSFGLWIFLPSALASDEPLMYRRARPLQTTTLPADPSGENDSKPPVVLPALVDSIAPDKPFSPPDPAAVFDPMKISEIQLKPVAIMNKVNKEGSQGYLYRIDDTGAIDARPSIIENPIAVMGAPDEDALIGSLQDPGFTANQELKLYLVKSSVTVAELNSIDIPGDQFAEVFVSGNSVKFYALADDFEPTGPGATQTFSLFTPLTVSPTSAGLQPPPD